MADGLVLQQIGQPGRDAFEVFAALGKHVGAHKYVANLVQVLCLRLLVEHGVRDGLAGSDEASQHLPGGGVA
ncbi:hypothetical protein ABZ671_32570 [Micromonospora sp. NPDC006766]|uniref:hypothetical protein n=1 Tax=Micromonospora sp. NPDC006766 TaxID=3154778 RepID=UPI0033E6BCFD